ncbi:phosphoenolpyruvate--protein phosphotransferase [bacterium]|nr:phosphoenolpyruvate--protein phosphotransferase [bacterium]
MTQRIYKGIGSGSGFAIAPAVVVQRGELAVPYQEISEDNISQEQKRFRNSIQITKDQLFRIRAAIAKTMGEEAAGVIDAQLLVLSDPACIDETEKIIARKKINAEHAFDTVMQSAVQALDNSKDALFRERIQDFTDVKRRVIANLMGLKHQVIPTPERESILVISHLAPSETAHLFGSKFVGLVTEVGGFTSHISIMARTMDLPAVVGIDNATEIIPENAQTIVDSMRGQVIIDPEKPILNEYTRRKKIFVHRHDLIQGVIDKPAVTKDGHRITISANMELPEEVPLTKHYGAEGIGLFRTELLYGAKEKLPSEDEQFEIYRDIVQQLEPHSAIIRTFDIGGDKLVGVLGHQYEPNPFLGFRAIRIGLAHPKILKTQIRALFRASAFGKLKIMFPMVSLPEEMQKARTMVDEVKEELTSKDIPFDPNIEIGAMVEVPSAAILSRELALYCDFFSIGSNDLVQYTLAADRGNPKVANIYQEFQPAVLKLIKYTIDSGHLMERWVGLCGELAGEIYAVPMLLGMGLDEFSVVPARVPLVKYIVRATSMQQARKIAETVLRMSTQDEVQSFLKEKVHEILPEDFFIEDE